MESDQSMEQTKYDVIIIGAGPVGFSCGIEAQKRGLSHLLIDKGCLVNSIYNFPTNMTFFSTSERLEIGDVPFIAHGFKPNRTEALEYYRRVKEKWNLNARQYEKVEGISGELGNFTVHTRLGNYASRAVIIATGFYDNPNMLNVPGEDLPKVKHYFDEPHPYAYHKIAIVGAGNSAVDAALETFRRSADVTMIVRGPALKPSVKYWVKPDIENRLKEEAIKGYFNATVAEIRETEIDINTPDGQVTIENDFVLAMTGFRPEYKFLRHLGVTIDTDEFETPIYHPDTFETAREGVFLAGVVCGGLKTGRWFIENAHDHAVRIFDRLDVYSRVEN